EQVWGDQWRSTDPVPEPPSDAAPTDGPVDWAMAGLTSRYTAASVTRFARRYPKSKATSLDSLHAMIIDVLCSGDDRLTDDDEGELLPCEPDEREHPLAEHLAALHRYVTVAQHYPERWGHFPVSLLPKEREGEPNASTVRPLSVQPFFRLSYEGIAHTFLSSANWVKLHPAQAGFRRGFSCLSTLACAEDEAKAGDRPIKIYLDFSRAYDSVRAKFVLEVAREWGCPTVLLPLFWSMLTSGLSATIMVNGARSSRLPIRIGLPQGGILSTLFFNFFINPLVERLNAGADVAKFLARFFADDGALRVGDQAEGQRLMDIAREWADEKEMRFGWKKCAVVAPTPITINLYPDTPPLLQPDSYTYLGVPERHDGLDLHAYLVNVLDRMESSLRGMRASGGSWPPAMRLAIYRSFCRPIGDYAAGFVYNWLQAYPLLSTLEVFKRLQRLHESAVSWICGVNKANAAAEAMTGLLAPLPRLEHLSLSLRLHLENANAANPVRSVLFSRTPSSSPIIMGIRSSPIRQRLIDYNIELALDGDDPVSGSTYARQLRRTALAQHPNGVLARCIGAGPHRTSALVDRVLTAPEPYSRRLAIDWRANRFGMKRRGTRCVCGEPWNRRHAACLVEAVGLVDEDGGKLDVAEVAELVWEAATAWANSGYADTVGLYNIIDYLLGHVDAYRAGIALATLPRWLDVLDGRLR
ncbi:MAG: hypothetical protein EOO77_17420, partial [Oxalobacteraceae bacterium]